MAIYREKRMDSRIKKAPWEDIPDAPFEKESELVKIVKENVLIEKMDIAPLLKTLTDNKSPEIMAKLQKTIETVMGQLPKSMLEAVIATERNTKTVMSLVEYMKREKENKQPIVINIPQATGWNFKVKRDVNGDLSEFDANRKE